jgi:ethanolamine ammonia-lyase small subunit
VSHWNKLKSLTNARVGLGLIGSSLPSQRVLEFQRAHAAARSAVWKEWNAKGLQKELSELGESALLLQSSVSDRETYLRFPKKGRTLSESSKNILQPMQTDLAFTVSDGLSALAIENHFLPFWKTFAPLCKESFPDLTYRLLLVPFGRVAISDEIGAPLKAKLSVIFIGERPGLNSPDSLGIYLTFNPTKGNSDAQRNCISNVRAPHGLNYDIASHKLIYLMKESLRLQLSGVNLKDELEIKKIGL